MNFKSIINDVCCDSRIKNGVLDIKNADHVLSTDIWENVEFQLMKL